MTTTTPGTTLAEELEQAASRIDCRCRDFGKPCARELEAARIRARAERVRELVSVWENQNLTGQCVDQIRKRLRFLCGPLSGPPARSE